MLALPILNSPTLKFYTLLGIIVMMSQFSISLSEPVQFIKCGDTGSGTKDTCDIKNVTIDPCPEASENETCNAYRGSNMSIAFDWYPAFSASNFTSAIYSTTFLVDIPDIDHSRPGCQYTKCPIVAGEKHTFKATRFVRPEYPPGTYLVKYKLWAESSKSECCFLVNVVIT